MPDHYYSPQPQSAHKPAVLSFAYRGHSLRFQTDSGVFSRLDIDKGTALLLDTLPQALSGSVLDMGCGYGVIGISVGKAYPVCAVTLVDINARAVALTRENAQTNGVAVHAVESDGYAEIPLLAIVNCQIVLQVMGVVFGNVVYDNLFSVKIEKLAANFTAD